MPPMNNSDDIQSQGELDQLQRDREKSHPRDRVLSEEYYRANSAVSARDRRVASISFIDQAITRVDSEVVVKMTLEEKTTWEKSKDDIKKEKDGIMGFSPFSFVARYTSDGEPVTDISPSNGMQGFGSFPLQTVRDQQLPLFMQNFREDLEEWRWNRLHPNVEFLAQILMDNSILPRKASRVQLAEHINTEPSVKTRLLRNMRPPEDEDGDV